jgi:phosphate transport system substrate-binding protein
MTLAVYGVIKIFGTISPKEIISLKQEDIKITKICCESASLLISDKTNGSEGEIGQVRGQPFTDYSQNIEMSPKWVVKPILYDTWAEGHDLAVTLDQHLYSALILLIQKFEQEQNVDIAVKEGTCGISAGMLIKKQVDIAGFCCPPGKGDRLPGLHFHTIGIASLAILVHKNNLFDDISLPVIRNIFQGKYYKWSELIDKEGTPGPDIYIHAIGRLHCKARPGHWRLLLDNENLFSTRLKEVGTIPDMLSQVATHIGGIGYEVLWNIHRYQQFDKLKFLTIDGYSPVIPEHLISGKYPLYRTYNLTTWEGEKTKNPLAHQLVSYLLKTVKEIKPEHGIIPASELRKQGWRFRGTELIGEPQ